MIPDCDATHVFQVVIAAAYFDTDQDEIADVIKVLASLRKADRVAILKKMTEFSS